MWEMYVVSYIAIATHGLFLSNAKCPLGHDHRSLCVRYKLPNHISSVVVLVSDHINIILGLIGDAADNKQAALKKKKRSERYVELQR